ncbi:MAG: gliding motility-associated C-terminal domain-containing protein [Prevotellaceae bacterium]|jgi:gliding motility-associated-like protein|nr:gliding motility-associated C-terminal domain-containing protein [Prevotellaceae bacterium]
MKTGKHCWLNKYFICLIFGFLFGLSSTSLLGQYTTQGKDFWLSFGSNNNEDIDSLALQIRVVTLQATSVTFSFTETGKDTTINLPANTVYTKNLDMAEKEATYAIGTRKTSKSIHIQSSANIAVYAINLSQATSDATIVLPTNSLNRSYFHISYILPTPGGLDGYLAIATENNTEIYDNGVLRATLNRGEVYARYASNDMTGRNITSNHPIAFFNANICVYVPENIKACDCLYEQLFPTALWGKRFMVPLTIRGKERVRVVASQDATTITHIGGYVTDGSLNLNAGDFVELEIDMAYDDGCYIEANKPIAVTSYLTSLDYHAYYNMGDPAMAWIPSVEQSTTELIIAPFIAAGFSILKEHYAMIVVPQTAKSQTEMKIGNGSFTPLAGGFWTDHPSGYSYYTMPLDDNGYTYRNPNGLTILGFGFGNYESYYYLAGSSLRKLDAFFYVNEIYYQNLETEMFCPGNFDVRAEIKYSLDASAGRVKWFIDGIEETAARDQITWSKSLSSGEHTITMAARDEHGYSDTVKGTIIVVPKLTGGDVAGNQKICYNTAPDLLTASLPTGGTGKYWYIWQISTDSLTWTDLAGATEQNHSYTNALIDTVFFRRKTSDSCSEAYSNAIKIMPVPPLEAGQIAADRTVCYNSVPDEFTGTTPIGGTGTYSYQWQWSADNVNWTDIGGANELNYLSDALSELRYFRRQTSDAKCGTRLSNIITVNILPSIVAGTISDDTTICRNTVPAQFTGTASTDGTGVYVYQWQQSTDGDNWTDIDNATEQDFMPTDSLNTITYFRRQTSGPECVPVWSNTITVDIHPETEILPETLPPFRSNTEYFQTLTANAVLPQFSSPDLPDGLYLTQSGELSGLLDIKGNATLPFTVFVEDKHGCIVSRNYILLSEVAPPQIFTPNGDGINDVFMSGYKIIVFDRLGVEIYKSDNGWDGTYKGKTVPSDIYFYKLIYNREGKTFTITGYVGVEQ